MFLAGSTYGFIVPVIKHGADVGIFPSTFIPMQYLFSLIVCLVIMFARRIPWGSPRQFLPLVVLGFFTGGTSICYYNAVTLLPSSAALTLLFQYIWVSVLIECIHKKKLPTASTVVAVVIVLIGTVFATGLFDSAAQPLDPIGVAYGIGSAVFYALFLYVSGTLGTEQPFVLRTTMLALGGLIISSIVQPMAYVNALPNPETWPYAMGLGCLGILIPTSIINFASPHLSAGMVSIMASSELPVGILAAWAFVADVPTPLVLFGAFLVLVGIVCKQAPTLYAEMRERRRDS